jgi:sulfur-oxidizing protein SoxY
MGEISMSDYQFKAQAVSRRNFLTFGTAAIATLATAGLLPGMAFATPEETEARIKELTKGNKIKDGKIKFKMPHVAENGNTVPVTIAVDSPMTESDHVTSIHLLAEKNPGTDIAIFHFTPMSGEAKVSTRVRLAKTQNVVAVAQMSDGSIYVGKHMVKVTIGGCGG